MNSTLVKSISENEKILLRELRSVGETLMVEIVKQFLQSILIGPFKAGFSLETHLINLFMLWSSKGG